MRYPSGILQEAVLLDNDDGILNFQFGDFVRESVGPVTDIFLNSRGECSVIGESDSLIKETHA